MELEHIKNIEEALEMDTTWTAKRLAFKIEKGVTTIDVIPYLGGCSGSPKLDETLSFPNPSCWC
jgi:hypothetical protein